MNFRFLNKPFMRAKEVSSFVAIEAHYFLKLVALLKCFIAE